MCVDWLEVKKDDQTADKVNYFHWDLVDGVFAPDFTDCSSIINTIRELYQNKGDFHFMIDEPSRLFSSFNMQEGDRAYIHVECKIFIEILLVKRFRKSKRRICITLQLQSEFRIYFRRYRVEFFLTSFFVFSSGFPLNDVRPEEKKKEAQSHLIDVLVTQHAITYIDIVRRWPRF